MLIINSYQSWEGRKKDIALHCWLIRCWQKGAAKKPSNNLVNKMTKMNVRVKNVHVWRENKKINLQSCSRSYIFDTTWQQLCIRGFLKSGIIRGGAGEDDHLPSLSSHHLRAERPEAHSPLWVHLSLMLFTPFLLCNWENVFVILLVFCTYCLKKIHLVMYLIRASFWHY